MWKAIGESGMQQGQIEQGGTGVQTKGKNPSGVIEQRTTDQVDGHAVIVAGGTAEAGEIGGGFVLAGGIQRAEPDDHIAQGRQVLRGVAGAGGGSIFAEGDIAHVVDRFDAPMAAAQGLQLRRVHLRVAAAAQEDFAVFGDPEAFEMVSRADDRGGLDGVGKPQCWGVSSKG